MNKKPISYLKQNSFLKIFISTEGIYSSLAYSDGMSGKNYVFYDFTGMKLSELNSFVDGEENFWQDYFHSLGLKFGWILVDRKNNAFHFESYMSEGVGVTDYVINIDIDENLASILVEKLKKTFPVENITIQKNDKKLNILRQNFIKLDYKDCIYLDINDNFIEIYRWEEDKKDGELKLSGGYKMDIKDEEIIKTSINSNFAKFLVTSDIVDINSWANFIFSNCEPGDAIYTDYFRGYFLSLLLDFSNSNENFTSDFGRVNDESLINIYKKKTSEERNYADSSIIVLSGELTRKLKFSSILLTIIDGLQLKNHFDLIIDTNKQLLLWGENYFYGSNSKDIMIFSKNILPPVNRVILPTIYETKANLFKRKVAGRLKFTDSSEHEESVESSYLHFPEINVVDVDKFNNQRKYMHFDFGDNTWNKDGERRGCFLINPEKIKYDKFIFDCRLKPAMYGPNSAMNRKRFKFWNVL